MNDTNVSKEIQTFPTDLVLELPEEIFLPIYNIITRQNGSMVCSMRLNTDIFKQGNDNFKNEAIEKATSIMLKYGIDFEEALKPDNKNTIIVDGKALLVVVFKMNDITKEDILNLKAKGKLFEGVVFDNWKAFADYYIGSILMGKPKTKTRPHFDKQDITVVDLRFNDYMRIFMHGHVFILDKPLEQRQYVDLHSELKYHVSDFLRIFFNNKLLKDYFEKLRGDFELVRRGEQEIMCELVYKHNGKEHELIYMSWHPLMLDVLRITKPYKR